MSTDQRHPLCRDDDGVAPALIRRVCAWCKADMGAAVTVDAGRHYAVKFRCVAGRVEIDPVITHGICPTCHALMLAELPSPRPNFAPPPSPVTGLKRTSPATGHASFVDEAAARPAVSTLPGTQRPAGDNGTTAPAEDPAAVLEHPSGGPAASSTFNAAPRPLFWTVQGYDFGRAIAWARRQGSALRAHVSRYTREGGQSHG